MKISEAINQLQTTFKNYGDMDIMCVGSVAANGTFYKVSNTLLSQFYITEEAIKNKDTVPLVLSAEMGNGQPVTPTE